MPSTLPDDPFYSLLLSVAQQQGDRIIVDDRSRDSQFGYLDILNGTVKLKEQLQQQLDPALLEKRGEFFVALLAPNGYEFIVGVLATLALGGVIVPVPIGALPAEIALVLRHCNAEVLLVGPEHIELAAQIRAEIPIISLEVEGQATDPSKLAPVTSYFLEKSLSVGEDTPSILFFTSGTTGPPKGVLHARRTINKYARNSTTEASDEVCLIPRGTFWSIYFTKLFQMLLLGVRVEIQNFGRNYDLIWEKLRQRNSTKIVLSPTFWYGMMTHYNTHIITQDERTRMDYVEGFRYLRDACITGAMPSAKLKEFWRELRGGRPLKVLYGTTETQEISVAYEDEYSEKAGSSS
ncbi:Malonate--CoA ligase ACSF3, mitochondrial [Pseudocercospora fuligena]|uniref:Malonate--CoA ligase ACSF3, mitochondrial n=1 Tax=Pseudocercospora fuligena TaxID=685502 RepID=A0A8H6RIS1_9PEZI|nr:Malonate--CoA ligase ACSF3, mitochondrial [Pseudocercospora fuligena]